MGKWRREYCGRLVSGGKENDKGEMEEGYIWRCERGAYGDVRGIDGRGVHMEM